MTRRKLENALKKLKSVECESHVAGGILFGIGRLYMLENKVTLEQEYFNMDRLVILLNKMESIAPYKDWSVA